MSVQTLGNKAWEPFAVPTGLPNEQDGGNAPTVYFLSPQIAWLAWISSSKTHELLHTANTHNGGATWSHYKNVVPIQLQNVDSVAFATRTQGWALTSSAMSAGQISFTLFTTSDGGRHWKNTDNSNALASLHGDAAISLSPSGQDWISGMDARPNLDGTTEVYLATSRAGGPWRRLSLPVPSALARGYYTVSQPPTEQGNQVEVTVDFAASDSTKTYFVSYKSSDGGASWSAGQPIAGSAMTSFLTPRDGFALEARSLYSTSDGGNTWRAVPAHLPSPGVVTSLHMVSRSRGWAVVTRLGSSHLIKTSDGGLSWSAVH